MTTQLCLRSVRRRVCFSVAVVSLTICSTNAVAQESGGFTCNLVLGSSQAQQWFETGGVFQSIVDGDRWQLKWAVEAGVDRWGDLSDSIWQAETLSTCERRAADFPDRVVFAVSGSLGDDEDAWVEDITNAVDAIFIRFASTNRIDLLPTIGGPDDQECRYQDAHVQSSQQHTHIEAAINRVVAEDTTGVLVAGPSQHLQDCSGYRDVLGHLTDAAAETVGRVLGEHYRDY